MQPQILSLGDRWFHLLCGLSSPSPFLPDSDKRLYRAEALSGEEESNKSMVAGAWRLLQEERSFPLPPALEGCRGLGWQQSSRVSPAPQLFTSPRGGATGQRGHRWNVGKTEHLLCWE